jgi:hypothetical protein
MTDQTNEDRKREKAALDLLQKLMKLIPQMWKYDPPEAARAFLKYPGPDRATEAIKTSAEWLAAVAAESPDRATEAIKTSAEWLAAVAAEMEANTTPGNLRLVKPGTEEEDSR